MTEQKPSDWLPSQPGQKMTILKKIGIGVGAFFAVIITLSVIGANLPDARKAEPAVTVTKTAPAAVVTSTAAAPTTSSAETSAAPSTTAPPTTQAPATTSKAPAPATTTKPPATTQPPSTNTFDGYVTAGSYCKTIYAGWYGYTSTGLKMQCKASATDSRLRWRAA